MILFLVEDERAGLWSPFAESRPVGELLFGDCLLRERIERGLGLPCSGYLGRPDMRGFDEPGAPAGQTPEVAPDGGALLWLSRAAPAWGPIPSGTNAGPCQWIMNGTVVGVSVPGGTRLSEAAARLCTPPEGAIPTEAVSGLLLGWPWELVEHNAAVLTGDLMGRLQEEPHGEDARTVADLAGVFGIGDGPVSLGPGSGVGPGVILDTRGGPIRLEAGVQVAGPARLVGPVHLGRGCQVFGGHLSRLSAGPVCKLRGEIDTAVLTGFVNKAHDGYLGHALTGRWVNLGALTTNSDLKNDYGPVRVELPGGTVDTGMMKVGVFLGDHVKTGIGTVLNTGSVVGAGSNVFGGGMPPKALPPYSWAGGGQVVPFRWEKFLQVARVVAARRDQPWTPGVEAILRRLWERTHGNGG